MKQERPRARSVRLSHSVISMVVASALLATGCLGRSPEVHHYILGTSGAKVEAGSAPDVAVLVGPVRLPAYLDWPQIVRLQPSGLVERDERHRWLGGFEGNFLRALTSGLARKLGSARIVSHPSKAPFPIDFRVRLHVDDLIDVGGNALRVRIRWSLERMQEGSQAPATISMMEVTTPIESGGSEYVVEAHEVVLDQLAQTIAAAISSQLRSR